MTDLTEKGEVTPAQGPEFILSKILVGLDGSEVSLRAAKYAVKLAERNNVNEVIALTVLQMPSILGFDESLLDKWRKAAYIESEKIFDKVREMIEHESSKIKLETQLLDSSVSPELTIVDYSDKQNVDLIVVGTRGKTGLKKMLLGSVASGVVTYATCPVLVVK